MRAIIHSETAHWFESDVLDAAVRVDLDGIVTNNLLIPHPNRELPNEHDIVVLLPGRVVTIDAKALWEGTYRRGQGGWEERVDATTWRPVQFLSDPDQVRLKKLNVMVEHVRALLKAAGSRAEPEVVSCIVVPDHADITALQADAAPGRHYTIQLRSLPEVLRGELRRFPRKRPTPQELVDLLRVPTRAHESAQPVVLADVELVRPVPSPPVPFPRQLFEGIQRVAPTRSDGQACAPAAERRVLIEVCERYGQSARVAHVARGFTTNSASLFALDDPSILRIHNVIESPLALVCMYEHFSTTSLQTMLEAGVRLPWASARRIFHELAAGVHDAHKARIFHRLIEPGYILVDVSRERSPVRLYGFWGGKALEFTTVGLRAPESPYRLPGEAGGDDLALRDAYSLGRCMAAALTGTPEGLPGTADAPQEIATLLLGLTSRDERQRARAWPEMRKALRG